MPGCASDPAVHHGGVNELEHCPGRRFLRLGVNAGEQGSVVRSRLGIRTSDQPDPRHATLPKNYASTNSFSIFLARRAVGQSNGTDSHAGGDFVVHRQRSDGPLANVEVG